MHTHMHTHTHTHTHTRTHTHTPYTHLLKNKENIEGGGAEKQASKDRS